MPDFGVGLSRIVVELARRPVVAIVAEALSVARGYTPRKNKSDVKLDAGIRRSLMADVEEFASFNGAPRTSTDS